MGGRVVGLEPDGLLVLEDGALGLPRVEIGAGQTKADDRVVRHQLGHFLELRDAITLAHGPLPSRASRPRYLLEPGRVTWRRLLTRGSPEPLTWQCNPRGRPLTMRPSWRTGGSAAWARRPSWPPSAPIA